MLGLETRKSRIRVLFVSKASVPQCDGKKHSKTENADFVSQNNHFVFEGLKWADGEKKDQRTEEIIRPGVLPKVSFYIMLFTNWGMGFCSYRSYFYLIFI